MVSFFLNDLEYKILQKDYSIFEICKFFGIKIPHFCYHESLSIAANCRLCLVEIIDREKFIASCSSRLENNMVLATKGYSLFKARENILEFLLLNHPIDCPICDQAGNCDLQDQSKKFGTFQNKYHFNKRGVDDKNMNIFIKTIMTRCINCTRCVRFNEELNEESTLGTLNRSSGSEIGTYFFKENIFSNLSGNLIDLCPVGAITNKTNSFSIRAWDYKSYATIDLTDSFGSNIYIIKDGFTDLKILPKLNFVLNGYFITNSIRFSFDNIVSYSRLFCIKYKLNNLIKYI